MQWFSQNERGRSNTNMKFDFKLNNIKLEEATDILTIDEFDDNEIFTTI